MKNDKISAIAYDLEIDTLLNTYIKENEEIYKISEESNQLEHESLFKLPEWCPKVSAVSAEVVPPDKNSPPESLPAFQAVMWEPNHLGVDMRPHIYDKVTKKWNLVDSGSMVTAFPPEPGDQPVEDMFLKAVNGSKIRC